MDEKQWSFANIAAFLDPGRSSAGHGDGRAAAVRCDGERSRALPDRSAGPGTPFAAPSGGTGEPADSVGRTKKPELYAGSGHSCAALPSAEPILISEQEVSI